MPASAQTCPRPTHSFRHERTIVVFNLGTCDGKLMYQAMEWYLPQHGERFNPSQYEDVCTGSYVPSS